MSRGFRKGLGNGKARLVGRRSASEMVEKDDAMLVEYYDKSSDCKKNRKTILWNVVGGVLIQ